MSRTVLIIVSGRFCHFLHCRRPEARVEAGAELAVPRRYPSMRPRSIHPSRAAPSSRPMCVRMNALRDDRRLSRHSPAYGPECGVPPLDRMGALWHNPSTYRYPQYQHGTSITGLPWPPLRMCCSRAAGWSRWRDDARACSVPHVCCSVLTEYAVRALRDEGPVS